MKLLRSFSLYTFVGIFGGMVGLLIMPVLTNYLDPKDYGIIALFNTYITFLVPILGLNAAGLINVEYFNKDNTKSEFKSIYTSILSIPILPTLVISLLFYFFSDSLSGLLELPASHLWLIPVIAFLIYYHHHILHFLATLKKALVYAVVNIGKIIFEVTLTLVLIIGYGMDWEGRIDSLFVTMILIFIFVLIYSMKKDLVSKTVSKTNIMAGISFGAPLIMHAIGNIVITQSDRIFIAKMVSLDEMGVYNTGFQIGGILLILARAFVNIYNPYLYERMAEITEKKKIEIVRLSYIYLLGSAAILALITLLSPLFYQLFINENYAEGVQYVFWIGLGYYFWGGYWIFSGVLMYLKKTKTLGLLSVLNIILNLGLNYVLILEFGAIGAAYATAISFFVVLILIFVFSSRAYKLPWFDFAQILNRKG